MNYQKIEYLILKYYYTKLFITANNFRNLRILQNAENYGNIIENWYNFNMVNIL